MKNTVRLSLLKRLWFRECPECRSHEVRRSGRRRISPEGLLSLALLRPFRCARCNNRYFDFFYKRQYKSNDAASEQDLS